MSAHERSGPGHWVLAAAGALLLLAVCAACAGNSTEGEPEWVAQPAPQGEPMDGLLVREYENLDQVAEDTDAVAVVTVSSQRVEYVTGAAFTFSTVRVVDTTDDLPGTFDWVQTGSRIDEVYMEELPPLAVEGETYLVAFSLYEWDGNDIANSVGPAVWIVDGDTASLWATEAQDVAASVPRVENVEELIGELSQ